MRFLPYYERMRRRLDAWNSQINHLVALSRRGGQLDDGIRAVLAEREELSRRIEALKTTPYGRTVAARRSVDRAWKRLRTAWMRAVDRTVVGV